MRTNQKIVMKQLPVGKPTEDDFEIVQEDLPAIAEGQMLLKTRWLTLDPYMRSGFMADVSNIGKTVIGGTVSEVIESKAVDWSVGDLVVGYYGCLFLRQRTAYDIGAFWLRGSTKSCALGLRTTKYLSWLCELRCI